MIERSGFLRTEALFHQLIEMPAVERALHLSEISKRDPATHADLINLLVESLDVRARESALEGLASNARNFGRSEAELPSTIGPYRIVRLLGEGGMGRVYEAVQDEPVQRRVALKLTRTGIDPERILARFQAERQALAVLDHANIARIHDAGALSDGRPWFAMELVDGVPITQWARQHQLSLRERIELLLPVCDAVQHAHRKGVIHRDIKPSNILVAEQDGVAVPKVIDFGIAKAIESQPLAAAFATHFGELVGTPEYMSPEQATLGAVDVDTRSDIYALGLVLYELLVGDLPMPIDVLRRFAFDEMCRHIREDDTPRPSVRLADLSQQRAALITSPDWVRRLRGDLDAVVLKALAKDRDQRYGTAAAFADDLRRFLDDQAVLATPPSFGYRLRKLVRRHRVGSVATVMVVLALVAGTVIALIGLQAAKRAEAQAIAAQKSAEATADFMVQLFDSADPRADAGRDPGARELLDRGAARMDELDASTEVRARLLESLGAASLALGDLARAETMIDQAIQLREAEPHDPERFARLLDRRGVLYRDRAQWDEAIASHRRALALLKNAGLSNSPVAATPLNNLGVALRRAGRLDDAAEIYQQAIGLAQMTEGAQSKGMASALANLSAVYQSRGDQVAARKQLESALQIMRQRLPDTHPDMSVLLSNLALIERNLGMLGESVVHARAAQAIDNASLPPDHPERADTLLNVASVWMRLARWDEARQALLEGGRLYALQYEVQHPRRLIVADSLAQIDLERGDNEKAATEFARIAALLSQSESVGSAHHRVLVLRKQVLALRRLRRWNEATGRLNAALALAELQDRTSDRAVLLVLSALLHLDRNEPGAAEADFQSAMQIAGQCAQPDCVLDRPDRLVMRAHYWARTGEAVQALDALEKSIAGRGWTANMLDAIDLESLHDKPGWHALQSELQQRIDETNRLIDAAPALTQTPQMPR